MDNNVNTLYDLINNMGNLLVEAYGESSQHTVNNLDEILICGMGGSGIGGDYIKAIAGNLNFERPIHILKNYGGNIRLREGMLVIVVSYSGNTEETISLTLESIENNIKPYVLSSGGKLRDIAEKHDLTFIQIKSGLLPRAAFPLLFGSLLGLLSGVLGSKEDFLQFKNSRPKVLDLSTHNRKLENIIGTFPIILAPEKYSCVAYRFMCQFSENSKIPSMWHVVPEFSHNGIVSLDGKYADKISLVLIKPREIHSRVKIHFDSIIQIAGEKSIPILVLEAKSTNFLDQLIEYTSIGDYISVRLAELQNVDPFSTSGIDNLKKELKGKIE